MSAIVKASADYKKLLSDITHLYQESRQALVKAYWQIGRRIVEVEQAGSSRAGYGEELLSKLSHDLTQACGQGFSKRNLERMRNFYLTNPKTTAPSQLSWTQQVELLPVKNKKKLFLIKKRAAREGLTSRQIRELVRSEVSAEDLQVKPKQSAEKEAPPELLKPIRGSLYTYRLRLDPIIQSAEPALRVDLGFSCYQEMNACCFSAGGGSAFGGKENDIVETFPHPRGVGTGYRLKKSTRTNTDLFTFKAYIERVIDGDTLVVQVDLGFSLWTRQTLRLRGIDAPEMDTAEGKKAKRFVETELTNAIAPESLSSPQSRLSSSRRRGSSSIKPYVIISSSKSDKYDRYLADIFYQTKDGEQYLNNRLLENRLAVQM